jgi:hypothetical protein
VFVNLLDQIINQISNIPSLNLGDINVKNQLSVAIIRQALEDDQKINLFKERVNNH